MKSLRARLLAGLLGVLALAAAVGGYGLYRSSLTEADELFDYQLRQTALAFRDRVYERAPEPAPGFPLGDEQARWDFIVQVWSRDGVRVFFSHPHSAVPEVARLGFADVSTPEGQWRTFAIQMGEGVVQAAQPQAVRKRMAAQFALRSLLPYLLLFPVIALLTWWVVGRALAPLGDLSRAVRERAPEALAPLPESDLPEEARPLVSSLNDLLARLAQALEARRAFVADAAHELRSPLTALRLQIQLAERAADDSARAEAHARLHEGVARATHLIEQLLTLARQDPAQLGESMAPIDLLEAARLAAADCAPLAAERGIELGLEGAPVKVRGNAEALRLLVRNLIDNAVRYTPRDGRVDAAVTTDADGVRLEVCDTGPGIPEVDRARVFDRFFRRDGMESSGSGLGLSIVKRIVEAHHAQVELADGPDGRGLRAVVRFPSSGRAPVLS